ncbi:vicilin-like protein antimicrobial peptides 2-2-like protein [Trifolium pratense]|uniref:Vicilin-like protein antimicrobial peptides 2-2-like protein n=1 Tax=Trifolium pratense TaxID=57577 RepID=A0A2K3NI17_TRIPR|nr:vicilin-like protein antimicrobial peptides 2-2-like protein [Trifolium pratense]
MEPRSLFVPQYLDSNMIIFIRRGVAKLGFIYGDELEERRIQTGDIYVIPAGSVFYLVNIGEGQRLHVICSIDPSTSLGHTFQPFYIGGDNQQSILGGFGPTILETAFNESRAKIQRIFKKKQDGPIVFIDDSHSPSLWTKFLQLKKQAKVQKLKTLVQSQDEDEEQKQTSWSWRKLMESVLGKANNIENKDRADSPDSYNLYDRKPDFRNAYGWSSALDGGDYSPLKIPDIGVFHVNLTAGSMMAPHVNPRASEYSIVLRGYGRVQILFPNGSNAMETEIKVGDIFYIPRYFPFCQIASRNGPLEFIGFTTSSEKNNPQFLAGAASLLKTLLGPELAASFGVSEDTLRHVVDAQHDAVILSSTWAAPGGGGKKEEDVLHVETKGIEDLVNDVVMGVFE